MFFLFVFLVFTHFMMIRAQLDNNVVKILIKENGADQPPSCVLGERVRLEKRKFTLDIQSDLFIVKSYWEHKNKEVEDRHHLETLANSSFSISYEKAINASGQDSSRKFSYKYLHTQDSDPKFNGTWKFSFTMLKNNDPWLKDQEETVTCNCSTKVKTLGSTSNNNGGKGKENDTSKTFGDSNDGLTLPVIIMFSVLGVFVLAQSSYIIHGKLKRAAAKKKCEEEPKRIIPIAERPPLPLPTDEVVPEPQPPSMPTPGPLRKQHLPTAPPMTRENTYKSLASPLESRRAYMNRGLDTSEEGIPSPVFNRRCEGPLVPKQSFKALGRSVEELRTPDFPRKNSGPTLPRRSLKRKEVDESDEEPKTPGFIRRQMQAKLAQLPPKSFKQPKPLPRGPPTQEVAPTVNPMNRPDIMAQANELEQAMRMRRNVAEPVPPLPPLHPKKPGLASAPSFRQHDPRRMSDDEWQYEKLQPASKYLNNFSDYNNL